MTTVDAGNLTVLAAVRDSEWREHVGSRLHGCGTLVFVTDVRQIVSAIAVNTPSVVLWHLDLGVDSANEYVDAFRDIRSIAPSTAIIGYSDVSRASAQLLVLAGRAGVDRVLLRGFDDLKRGILETLRSTQIEWAIRRTVDLCDISQQSAAAAFEHSLRSTRSGPISVQGLAVALGVNRKTLGTWFRRAALPAPEQLISWCRVYWVAHLLRDQRRTVADVARTLRFSSESDLRRMVARYARCTPTELRHRGGAALLIAQLRDQGLCRRNLLQEQDASIV